MPTVVIVGAGISAIATAVSLKQQNIEDFVLVERTSRAGGTWAANKYPGCACDIPFILYTFSFLPHTNKEVFAPSDDIEQYLNRVVDMYGLRKHILFDTSVTSATWEDSTSSYTIQTTKGELSASFLVACTGQLNIPKVPHYIRAYLDAQAPGKQGRPIIIHSAEYDRSINLEGKTVAIIGNGSTGVQLVEAIQPIAGRLLLFQRSPKWVLPKPFLRFPSLLLTPLQTLLPFNLGNRIIRSACFLAIELLHAVVRRPSFVQRLFTRYLKNRILSANPDAAAMNCIPTFKPGCSRIIVHAGFSKALTQSNVAVISDPVAGLTEAGDILTESGGANAHKVDVIIAATGFSVTDCGPQFSVHNSAGESVQAVWRQSLEQWGGSTLFGIATPTFPNFFVVYGPHTNTILGSITHFSECAAKYISQCISGVMQFGKKSVEVREEEVVRYNAWIKKKFEGRPELDSCSAWYKGEGGGAVPITNFPGGMFEYAWLLRRWRIEDFTLK